MNASKVIVLDELARLAQEVEGKDAHAVAGLFEPDASLLGTARASLGSQAIESYVGAVVDQYPGFTWEWDEDSLVVDRSGDVIWFFVLGDALFVEAEGGDQQRSPMRLTGVLRRGQGEGWRWAQFHGSTPES